MMLTIGSSLVVIETVSEPEAPSSSVTVKRTAGAGRRVLPTHSTEIGMANSQSATPVSSEEETAGLQHNEIALRSEVGFWREMI